MQCKVKNESELVKIYKVIFDLADQVFTYSNKTD